MLLTEEENRTRTVESVNFIKEKRDWCIKDRTCVNGSIQHRYLKYGEIVSLPTVPLEALFVTLVVDKYEGRYFVTLDVTGVFLHAELQKDKKCS